MDPVEKIRQGDSERQRLDQVISKTIIPSVPVVNMNLLGHDKIALLAERQALTEEIGRLRTIRSAAAAELIQLRDALRRAQGAMIVLGGLKDPDHEQLNEWIIRLLLGDRAGAMAARAEELESWRTRTLAILDEMHKACNWWIEGMGPTTSDGKALRTKIDDFMTEMLATAPEPLKRLRPKIICLCGSTKFIETFAVTTWELELKGHIVLGCTMLPGWYCPVRDHFAEHQGVKTQRDAHHLQKIDLADEVLVLNVDGYIGESTRAEIAYATATGKPVKYIEPLNP